VFCKQAACKRLASTSFRRQLIDKLLVQRWRSSSGNVRLSHLLLRFFIVWGLCAHFLCRSKYSRITFDGFSTRNTSTTKRSTLLLRTASTTRNSCKRSYEKRIQKCWPSHLRSSRTKPTVVYVPFNAALIGLALAYLGSIQSNPIHSFISDNKVSSKKKRRQTQKLTYNNTTHGYITTETC